MSKDPFASGPRRPVGVIILWMIAILILVAALVIIFKGEQIRARLHTVHHGGFASKSARQHPAPGDSDKFH